MIFVVTQQIWHAWNAYIFYPSELKIFKVFLNFLVKFILRFQSNYSFLITLPIAHVSGLIVMTNL